MRPNLFTLIGIVATVGGLIWALVGPLRKQCLKPPENSEDAAAKRKRKRFCGLMWASGSLTSVVPIILIILTATIICENKTPSPLFDCREASGEYFSNVVLEGSTVNGDTGKFINSYIPDSSAPDTSYPSLYARSREEQYMRIEWEQEDSATCRGYVYTFPQEPHKWFLQRLLNRKYVKIEKKTEIIIDFEWLERIPDIPVSGEFGDSVARGSRIELSAVGRGCNSLPIELDKKKDEPVLIKLKAFLEQGVATAQVECFILHFYNKGEINIRNIELER